MTRISVLGLLSLYALGAQSWGPPGEFYSLGSHRLYMYCMGEGGPTVLFESGIGGSSYEWADIQEALRAEMRTCAYDRAGYGWSDPGPAPRTTAAIVAELRSLLKAAAIEPPYVLVGHSFGGYTAQYFMRAYPDETRGVLLLDSAHPRQDEYLAPLRAATGRRRQLNPIAMPEAEAGKRQTAFDEPPAGFLNTRRKAIFAQMSEFREFALSGRQVEAAGPVPDVPVEVISRGRRAWPAGAEGDRMEAAWRRLQRDLATELNAARHIIAEDSAHQIHVDAEREVLDAIRRLAASR